MKKYFIIAAAIVAMVSCQKNTSLEVAPNADGNAIGFNAYLGTAATKGLVAELDSIKTSGVGIFAFYQAALNGVPSYYNTKYCSTPSFMYNQKLEWDGTSAWKYTPVKYWPNNEGDLLTFFAYAPYEAGKSWDDMAIKTDAVASKLTASFSIADEVSKQKDILWADPKINQTNKKKASGDAYESNDTSNELTFAFKHVTSKVDIHVGVAQQVGITSPVAAAGAWTDPNTTITIKSIVFNGLYDGLDYVYTIDSKGALSSTYTPNNNNAGTFSLTVLPCSDAKTINKTTWATTELITATPNTNYKNYINNKSTIKKDLEFLFLAPQKFVDETVVITYEVDTKVAAGVDSANDSKITNVISRKLKDVFTNGGGEIKSGLAYNIQFLIGMDDVNINVTEDTWKDPIQEHVDVPANK